MRDAFLAQLSDADRASFLEAYPPYDCKLCGAHFEYADAGYEADFNVCCLCAERVANHYWQRHAGRWLTWPNPPLARTGQTKRKIKPTLRFKVYERDGFKCVYCGGRKDLTLDHVSAESGGGATEAGNLVTACRGCNTKKGTKTLLDFWESRS